jgi:hypothetical protein
MGRKIGAVAGGVAVVGVVVFSLQWVGTLIHPLPPGVNPGDPDDLPAFTAYLATMPFAAWALAWASEILGAFLGALTAGKIAETHRKRFAGGIVGVALLGSLTNWVSFPHPVWFMVGQLVAYPLVFLAASKFFPTNPYQEV